MSHVGIYGGTFDPIHLGHLITAQSVKEKRHLDKIIFVPNFISPHKTDQKASGKELRLKMLKAAIKGVDYFDFSDFELKNEGISYSIDTIKEFKKKHNEIDLIIGFDNLLEFKTWKNPDEILKLANLVVLRRRVEKDSDKKDKYYHAAIFVETPLIDISASTIRRRVRDNLPINFLVPEKVKEYIYNFNLYKE